MTRSRAPAVAVVLSLVGVLAAEACNGGSSGGKDAGYDAATKDDVSPADTGQDTESAEASGDAGPCPKLAMTNFGGPTCDSCASAHCCELGTACYSKPASTCALLANCAADCAGADGDAAADVPACTNACETQYASAKSEYVLLNACVTMACRNDAGTGPCDP